MNVSLLDATAARGKFDPCGNAERGARAAARRNPPVAAYTPAGAVYRGRGRRAADRGGWRVPWDSSRRGCGRAPWPIAPGSANGCGIFTPCGSDAGCGCVHATSTRRRGPKPRSDQCRGRAARSGFGIRHRHPSFHRDVPGVARNADARRVGAHRLRLRFRSARDRSAQTRRAPRLCVRRRSAGAARLARERRRQRSGGSPRALRERRRNCRAHAICCSPIY